MKYRPTLFAILSFLLIFAPAGVVNAANNPFGIHITDINEAEKARELVNSNGGEWGYVLITINSNDRVVQKWQERMNELNRRKLIPIIRIATYGNGAHWTKPVKDDAHDWAKFLDSLHWPTKERIVVIYNEPNHGSEWGGETNPAEYAEILSKTIEELKKLNNDFVVLNAGFDASTPQKPPAYMDQVAYMDAMEKAVPGIFKKLDAWSSHSYPNPGFSGKATDTGRGSIQSYKWELDLLKKRFGVDKELPVYITETGWVVKNADHPDLRIDEETAKTNMEYAFTEVWLKDPAVKAIIPFLLTYKSPLFSHFSWLRSDDSPTPMFSAIQNLQKTAGTPVREHKSVITNVTIPSQISQNTEVIASIAFKNIGNTVWNQEQNIRLNTNDEIGLIRRDDFGIPEKVTVLPGQSYVFRFTLFSDNILQKAAISLQLRQNETDFGERLFMPIKIYNPPRITVRVSNPPRRAIGATKIYFSRGKENDIISEVQVPTSGLVGTYTSKLAVPGDSIVVAIETPNRPLVYQKITVSEGENIASLELPRELTLFERLFR